MQALLIILEAVVLAASISIDAFVASFAYGSNKIKIPVGSIVAINIVCSGILAVSLYLGALVRPYLPPAVSNGICFAILLVIGVFKLLDNITKSFIQKHDDFTKNMNFSFLNLKFVLCVYADPEKADVDSSKTISIAEAISLAVALSFDGIAVGFGAALGNIHGIYVVLASIATDTAAVMLGSYLGHKLSTKLKFNISWLSGVVLIALAVIKII